MKKLITLAAVAAVTFATGAVAHHAENLDVPFPTRGGCEAENSALSNEDGWLLDAFPSLFSSEGEVRSFLNRAFTCERNQSDGNFYITDHRVEVLGSDWFQRRLP
ncbi:MAG: hypothetical protein ACJ8FN_07095 [Sphingomicrobium sp.]